MKQLKKWKASLPFILLFFIVLTIQFLHFLDFEQHSNLLPWSRSVDLQLETDNRLPFVRSSDEGFELYSARNGMMKQNVVKSDLSVEKNKDITVPIGSQDSFWTNGVEILYAKNNTLFHQDKSGQSTTILENVLQFKANEKIAIAITENEIFSIDFETMKPVKLTNTPGKVADLIVTLDPMSFITATDAGAGVLNFTFYQSDSSNWREFELFQYDTKLDSYAGLDYAVVDNTLHMIYTTSSRKGGGDLILKNFYTSADLSSLPTELSFTSLKIYEEGKQFQLDGINTFNIVDYNGAVHLLFGSSNEFNDKESVNIFIAKQEKEEWVANRLGTTYESSSKPLMINDSLITWLDFNVATKAYKVMGASTNEDALKASLQLKTDDYIRALSRTLLSFSGAFIFLAVSFLVLIPPALVLISMNFFRIYNKAKFMWIAIASYFVSQLIYVQQFFDSPTIKEGPFFINFSYSHYVLPIACIALSFFIYSFVRNRDWSEEINVTYIVSLHMFMMVIMVGPFVF